tara:strand:+ start:4930 stop:5934 length:1005 start_codon:yes stop_codon:yes gene_type:complete
MANSTTIIAEIGVNHNGQILLAKKLIKLAKIAGANIVKFQYFSAFNMVERKTKSAEYQKKNTGISSQYELLKKLELSIEQIEELKDYCKKVSIEFLCTAFNPNDLKMLVNLGMNKIKIPSGEINNKMLLKQACILNKEIYLSTGMANYKEIKKVYSYIRKNTKKNIYILHCTSLYPAPPSSLNLDFLSLIKEKITNNIGYSDHSKGIIASCVALGLGAKIIEKHITINEKLSGPDHKASLNPKEFKEFISKIRDTESMLGSRLRKPDTRENKIKTLVRKSWYTNTDIKKGQILNEKNIVLKRPLSHLDAWSIPIGKRSKKNLKRGKPIKKEDLL